MRLVINTVHVSLTEGADDGFLGFSPLSTGRNQRKDVNRLNFIGKQQKSSTDLRPELVLLSSSHPASLCRRVGQYDGEM